MVGSHPDTARDDSWHRSVLRGRGALLGIRAAFEMQPVAPGVALFAEISDGRVTAYLTPSAAAFRGVLDVFTSTWEPCHPPANSKYLRLVTGDAGAWTLVIPKPD